MVQKYVKTTTMFILAIVVNEIVLSYDSMLKFVVEDNWL